MGKTLFDKVWDSHVVYRKKAYPDVLYIDTHLIHEVTSPQAFEGMRKQGRSVFRPQKTWATMDHNVPTRDQHLPIQEKLSAFQVAALEKNCTEFGVQLFGLGHPNQGIVHIIGPELGITQPGKTMVCGDSHTSTHGAFGAIAFGIGTSEVEEVLTTQCILQNKPKRMRITIDGQLADGVVSKDLILFIISQLGTGGATGYFVEYAGEAIRSLSMEARMTICNMSIEMGARGGIIAPDEVTFAYLEGKEHAPKGAAWYEALNYWKSLPTDADAEFDLELSYHASEIEPMITYGTNPGMGIRISETIPAADSFTSINEKHSFKKSLQYMQLDEGQSMLGQKVDYVFIGSCTNARIEDLRLAANYLKDKQKSPLVEAWIVPGSKQVEKQAKAEGLDEVFKQAGFDLREPGCSACLAMNEDKVPEGKYCISTSNRNFEGRQGPGARTFLASPLMAAAAAVEGQIVDVREKLMQLA